METEIHHHSIPEVDVDIDQLLEATGKRVEVVAFDLAYSGTLTEVDVDKGQIRIEDGDDYVVLEVERLQSFRVLKKGVS